jgi:hypothetical protein
MTLRRVNYNGRTRLREMSADQWAAYQRAEKHLVPEENQQGKQGS